MFVNYLSRPNVRQPILTQYCDGDRVSCPNWMTQWGSKYLGDQGYSAIEILRYFYGNSMYINTAEQVSGVPASWPRVDLQVGSRGNNVRVIQEQIKCNCKKLPGNSDRNGRWYFRTGNKGGSTEVPVGVQPTGQRSGRLSDLV